MPALLHAATYPLTVVRVLVQCGYEPVAPVLSRDIFSRPVLVLPSFWTYGARPGAGGGRDAVSATLR